MPKHNGADLERDYIESDQVDSNKFSEMRSNVLLVSGDHYTKKGSKFWNRIKDNKDLSESQKLRLTQNHVQYIIKTYVGNIIGSIQGTIVGPANNIETGDQKAAELNNSVLHFYKKELNLRAKTRSSAENFFTLGEVYNKIFFDPNGGKVKAYEAKLDDFGQLIYDEYGQLVADETKPIMSGTVLVEDIYAFNLLRAPGIQDIEESPYLIVRKMIHRNRLKEMVPEGHPALKESTSEETYIVFDSEKGSYERSKNYVMLREHYFRPSKEYPDGYFYICVNSQIIFEDKLPFGIWPIVGRGCNKVPTSPRYDSPIKQMRPYQVEINRCASAIANTQITLGDDKLVLFNGAKISNGGTLPGIRAVTITGTGTPPTVMQGRSGEQYLAYMQSRIDELYKIMDVYEINPVREGVLDPYALLYQSARNKQKFSKYGEVFEEFVIERDEKILEIAKQYLEDDTIIQMVGSSEVVNIAEFKNTSPNSYKIRVEAVSDDAETMLGKQLAMNHTLQYVGNSLEKDDIGKILRAMPYLNKEEAFNDLTLDYDNAKNDILALERGEMPDVNPYDNHVYIIKRLVNRMRLPDFKYLDPQVQANFIQYKQMHEQIEAQIQQQLQFANSGFIPTGGYQITVDFYINTQDGKTQRAKIPYEALNWLIKKLEAQGSLLNQVSSLPPGAELEVSQLLAKNQQQYPPQMGYNQGVLQ